MGDITESYWAYEVQFYDQEAGHNDSTIVLVKMDAPVLENVFDFIDKHILRVIGEYGEVKVKHQHNIPLPKVLIEYL